MKTYLIYFLFLSLAFSCISIQGFTNDYGKLSDEQKSLISPLQNFDNLENGRIYKVNPIQLREEMKNYPKSLVYVFTNGCKTKYCLPMNIYINYAEKNGYKLFLVMNGYANLDETLDQMAETPYFSIDNAYYNSNNRAKYSNYFENELMGLDRDTKHKEYPGNLFFFENDRFTNVQRELMN